MILLNILTFVLISCTRGIVGVEKKITPRISAEKGVELFTGFRVAVFEHEMRIKLDLESMFSPNSVQARKHHDNENEKKPGGLMQTFGSMIAMIPLIMQMLSLPGAIASIKMSLLKSLVVAKLALLIMLFNALRNQRPTEIVMVHQASPPQHHDHFYPHFHEEYENDDKGWFG